MANPQSTATTNSLRTSLGIQELLGLLAGQLDRPLSIIQIGAYDGVSFDPLPRFVRDQPHNITLVEPNPAILETLRSNYKSNPLAQVVPVAVSTSRAKNTTLFTFNDELVKTYADWGGTTSTLRSHLEDGIERNKWKFPHDQDWSNAIEATVVPCMSVKDLLVTHGQEKIDLLLIDAEGLDWEILKQFDLKICKPRIIQFESRFLSERHLNHARKWLEKFDYEIFDGEEDCIAVRTSPASQ